MNYQKRIESFQKYMEEKGLDAFFVEDAVNIFYLTGLKMSAGQLLIHKEGSKLFVDARYFERASKESPIPTALCQSFSLLEALEEHAGDVKTLGFNSESLSYQRYLDLSKSAPLLTFIACQNPVKNILRVVKEREELDLMRKAADFGCEGFDFACSLLKEGITELEVASQLEIFWKKKGVSKTSFDPIVAFGKNSAIPHHETGETRLKKGDAVLFDIGVMYKHYCSDMTRVVFFGATDPVMEKIYYIVKSAQELALELCKAGVTPAELDKAARGYIEEKGYGKQFTHRLGHGVGLEIHEAPNVREGVDLPLEPGMVITIEPGIYVNNLGGVRIENSIVVTENGYENLTKRPTKLLNF